MRNFENCNNFKPNSEILVLLNSYVGYNLLRSTIYCNATKALLNNNAVGSFLDYSYHSLFLRIVAKFIIFSCTFLNVIYLFIR